MNVAILGASAKPDRYSYKALNSLREKGHRPFPVHPLLPNIEGLPVCKSLKDVPEPVHTVTVYLSATNSDKAAQDLLESGARRVIFNPGAENPALATRLAEKGIETVNACTLVMLATGRF
jgi:predicted CoA-binding protein